MEMDAINQVVWAPARIWGVLILLRCHLCPSPGGCHGMVAMGIPSAKRSVVPVSLGIFIHSGYYVEINVFDRGELISNANSHFTKWLALSPFLSISVA